MNKQKKRSGDQQHQSLRYYLQIIAFQQQEKAEIKNRIRAAWASFYRHKQELTSRSYLPQHRLRLFDMVITPTLNCASRTWTLPKRTRKNDTINSTKNASLHRPNKEKYKNKTQPSRNEEDEEDEKAKHRSSDEETAQGSGSNTDYDQDNDISFMKDTDEEIDTGEIEEEDWIEYMKRSTATAVEKMKAAKIPCWIETHTRLNWRLAMRIASLPDERWAKKAAKWNPSLSTKHQTKQASGKTKKEMGR